MIPLSLPPPQPPPTTSQPAPTKGHDGSVAGLVATLLPLAVILIALLWLAKPWKRTRLPRARVIEHHDSEDS